MATGLDTWDWGIQRPGGDNMWDSNLCSVLAISEQEFQDLKKQEINRLQWDNYFMSVAEMVAQQSKCLSRKVGAVAVKDKVIICTGYNGPARGIPHCWTRNEGNKMACPRKLLGYKSGEGLHLCLASHAEQSLIAQAARLGISLKDCSVFIFASIYPCTVCTGLMINTGIKDIIVPSYARPYDDMAKYQLENTKQLRLREISYKNRFDND